MRVLDQAKPGKLKARKRTALNNPGSLYSEQSLKLGMSRRVPPAVKTPYVKKLTASEKYKSEWRSNLDSNWNVSDRLSLLLSKLEIM